MIGGVLEEGNDEFQKLLKLYEDNYLARLSFCQRKLTQLYKAASLSFERSPFDHEPSTGMWFYRGGSKKPVAHWFDSGAETSLCTRLKPDSAGVAWRHPMHDQHVPLCQHCKERLESRKVVIMLIRLLDKKPLNP